jgi:hypothetical protein
LVGAGDAVADGTVVGLADGVAVAVPGGGVGLGDGVCVAVGVGAADGEGDGVSVAGTAVGVGDVVGVGDGVGVGAGPSSERSSRYTVKAPFAVTTSPKRAWTAPPGAVRLSVVVD